MAYAGPYIPDVGEEKQVAERAIPPPTNIDPNIGKPTSAWARLAKTGAAKVAGLIKETAVSTAKSGLDTAASLSNVELRHTGSGTLDNDIKSKFGSNPVQGMLNKSGKNIAPSVPYNSKYIASHSSNAQKLSSFMGTPNTKQTVGNAAQTAALLIPGGKAAEIGGEFLLKQLGEQGVKDLAEKVGVDAGEQSASELAAQVAKTKGGKAAGKILVKGGSSVASRALKAGAKSAAGFGVFGAGQAASNNESGKQILKAGATGAAEGAVAGGAGSLLKTAASRYKAGSDAADLKVTAAKHQTATKMANERGLPTGKINTTKELGSGDTTPKGLPSGQKVVPKATTKVTVVDKPAEIVTKESVEAAHKERVTNLGDQYVKDVGSAKTKAQEEAISGKTDTATAYKTHIDAANQKYEAGLADAEKTHQDNLKTVGTESKPAVTHEEERGFQTGVTKPSATEVAASKRVDQLDKLITSAQKEGTTKTAADLRSMMRERSSLQDVVSGKKTVDDIKTSVKDPVTVQELTEAASKDSGKTADLKAASDSADKTASTTPKPARTRSTLALNESGAAAPGRVAEDVGKVNSTVKDYVDRNQKGIKVSGDIKKDSQIHEATAKQRLVDSTKLLKKLGNVSKEDKEAVYDYREAKAAHQKLPQLTENQRNLHDIISQITKATNENKRGLVDLKAPGYSEERIVDHTSGNHRIALGKGSALERFGLRRQKTPLSARSLRTTAASGKARVFHSVIDEDGNRSVAAIKNVSVKQGLRNVSKGKYVNAIDDKGETTQLGKITPAELKSGSFVGKDGKTYRLGQATASEISKATGQKYLKDPLTSAIIDYHETTDALESAKMLESWKNSPDFQNIAVKHGEGVPPPKWKTTRLPQMQGYAFEPHVAEVLDDIYGSARDKAEIPSMVNHAVKSMMVAIPIRHNLNELGFNFVDRGASSLINPMAYKRGAQALVKAVGDVLNQTEDYRKVVGTGFNFMYTDDKGFANEVKNQTKSMLFDDQSTAEKIASDAKTTVANLRQAWTSVQHKGVWFQQDVLNMARINERVAKGSTLEDAADQTARFNPQYRVPSRVLGSRTASSLLRNNNLLFFGSYHYDQWKTMANVIGDAVGKNGLKAAGQSWDKLAAMTLGVYATYALVDKGLQHLSGNSNAYTKAFGNLDIGDQAYQLITGKKDISQVAQSELFPSVGLSAIAQLFENRDFFTGKQIRDPNETAKNQISQLGSWLESQLPTSQQVSNVKKGGSVTAGALALSGARFPANSSGNTKLNSLKYDTLPNVQSMAKKQAQAGNTGKAEQTISQYDKLLLAAAKSDLKQAGKPIPSDNDLIKTLKKQQYYYDPKPATIKKWSSERPTTITNQL